MLKVTVPLFEEPQASLRAYRQGVALVLLCALVWSFSGLIFRLVEAAGDWQLIFYRSLGVMLGSAFAVFLLHGRKAPRAFLHLGPLGAVAAGFQAGASLCFLIAIHHTTIANLSFMLAAHPFIAAVLAWVVLGERVKARTWIAAGLALLGVGTMLYDGLTFGGAFGNLLALGAALFSACYAVALRRGRGRDMTPAVALAGGFALLASAPLVESFAISWHDLGLCLLQGLVISAFCNCLYAYAARAVPAAELTLLTLLEAVLAPLWVFLVVAELPSSLTLTGGGIIFLAVAGHALGSLRFPAKRVAPYLPSGR